MNAVPCERSFSNQASTTRCLQNRTLCTLNNQAFANLHQQLTLPPTPPPPLPYVGSPSPPPPQSPLASCALAVLRLNITMGKPTSRRPCRVATVAKPGAQRKSSRGSQMVTGRSGSILSRIAQNLLLRNWQAFLVSPLPLPSPLASQLDPLCPGGMLHYNKEAVEYCINHATATLKSSSLRFIMAPLASLNGQQQ